MIESFLFLALTVPLAVWRPQLGLLAYLLLLFVRPHDLWGVLDQLRPMWVLGTVTLASALWHLRTRRREGLEAAQPFVALAAAVLLSMLASDAPETAVPPCPPIAAWHPGAGGGGSGGGPTDARGLHELPRQGVPRART